jgi:Na+-transporting NADH:ubiquinone oxidoreductase subunit NqrB
MPKKRNRNWSLSLLRSDPRYYQIAALFSLLIYGLGWLEFDIQWPQIVVSLGTGLLTQYGCTRIFRVPAFDARSPLISGLSLCLLLRSNSLLLAFLTAVVTIVSKFVLKRGGKHIFNPTNFGIVAMMLLTSQVWVSPAQWGSKLYFAFFIACAGGMVIYRAARSDVTYAFLFAYVGILFGRAFWLGDPWAIPLKQLQSGSLLLFAFYMISDPKTTPDSRIGRILFAIIVAAGAGYVQFGLYRTNGLLWSLALSSIITPIIDRLLPGTKYEWTSYSSPKHLKGEIRETNNLIPGHTYPVR